MLTIGGAVLRAERNREPPTERTADHRRPSSRGNVSIGDYSALGYRRRFDRRRERLADVPVARPPQYQPPERLGSCTRMFVPDLGSPKCTVPEGGAKVTRTWIENAVLRPLDVGAAIDRTRGAVAPDGRIHLVVM